VSFAQQRLWLLAQMEGVSEAYHMPLAFQLDGHLDVAALKRSLDRIVMRHEALRTTFLRVGEQVVQQIAAPGIGFDLRCRDLASPDELDTCMKREASQRFDVANGPLVRGQLLALSPVRHVLLITMHHIVSDAWSIGVLIAELNALYPAYMAGRDDPLPPLAIQYADYAMWQRERLSGDFLRRQTDYWRRALEGAPSLLALPTDRPRPAVQRFEGAEVAFGLGPELTRQLKALAQQHGMTLYMVILAAWSVVLSRLSGQQDIVVGSPVANRTSAQTEALIGFFVNTLALRVRVSGRFTDLLGQVRAVALDAQEHQMLPFEQVVNVVKPVRSLAHTPIVQVMLAWQNVDEGALRLPGLATSVTGAQYDIAKFDMELGLAEQGERIAGGLRYARALFERDTVERHVGYLRQVLAAVVADASQDVARIGLLSAAQRGQMLHDWNLAPPPVASGAVLHELFEARAQRSPEAVSVVCEGGALSYGELNARANRLARHLRSLGVGPDTPVGLSTGRSLEMVVGILAILKAGGGYVPLDPAYPAARLAHMLADSAPAAVLVHGPRALPDVGGVPVIDLVADAARWSHQPSVDLPRAGLAPSHLAYIIYTSGSTGLPKGVMVEHANVVRLLSSTEAWFGFGPGDVWTLFHSIAFDFSVWELWGALAYGGRLVVVPYETARSAPEFYALLCRERVTVLNQTPSAFRQLIAAQETSGEPHQLRTVVFGGEALDLHTLKPWYERPRNAGTQLVNMYGITETTVHVTYRPIEPADALRPGPSPIGVRIPDLRIYILDEHRQPVPVGVEGELYVGGAGVARGYLNRPGLNAERFLADPFAAAPAQRMYKTGDTGRYLADGSIEYLGRNDQQVKIRGFRIELGEIESRLALHASVEEAVVLAREDVPGDKRLVAYVRLAEGTGLDVDGLRRHLGGVLPEHMVPAAYVQVERLPLTGNGKLDRKALPAPGSDAYAARVYEAPAGPVENTIAAIWASVLKLDRIGRFDNFFELGGHSLLAVTVIERMRRAGLAADVRSLFAAPTLKELAHNVAVASHARFEVPPNRIGSDTREITPEMLPLVDLSQADIDRIVATVEGGVANVQDIYPLGTLQNGMLFHHQIQREGDVYLTTNLIRFDSRSHFDRYLAALQAVVARHDILRTAFVWEGLSEPVQVVWRHAAVRVEELTLDGDAASIAEQLAERFNPQNTRLDVRRAPLWRIALAEEKPSGRWVAVEMVHHLIDDNTSARFVRDEIQACLLGREAGLAAPVPFRDFVARARRARDDVAHEQFFRQMLGDIDEATLPFGLDDAQGDGSRIVATLQAVEPALVKRVRQEARAAGVSVASLCHMAWALVLARVTGRRDVVFGTVLFGRLQGEEGIDRALGMFINMLPIRLSVTAGSVLEGVQRAHALLSQLLLHEQAPLALAQRCSAVAPPAPLFTATLNYRHVRPGTPSAGQQAEAARAWGGIELVGGAERSNYPFGMSVNDLGDGLELDALVDASVDPERVCGMMCAALRGLVQALENAPQTPLCGIDVLVEAETERLLHAFNATHAGYPQDRLIHQLFEAQAERQPGAVAVVHEHGVLDFGDLNRRANRLAHFLVATGVVPDSRVALYMERSVDLLVAMLAVAKAGGAYVPIDPSYPTDRVAYMLQDCAPVAVVSQASLADRVPASLAHAIVVDDPGHAARVAEQSCENLPPASLRLDARHLAYVIYTSGSTGLPKGVMIEHRQLVNLALWHADAFAMTSATRSSWAAGLAFDASTWEIWPGLCAGGSLALPPAAAARDPGQLLRWWAGAALDVSFLPTPVAEAAFTEGLVNPLVRTLLVGGERLRRVPELPASLTLVNNYGPTETTVVATSGQVAQGGGPVHIGRPVANTQVRILDADGRLCPIGVAGELHVAGAQVARGYLNRAELTAERFVADPFGAPGARMYKTGDLARWLPDGTIEYLGRNDFQVKIRGLRIEPGEIENQLVACAGVRDAVVIAREDQPGAARLMAYLVAAPGLAPTAAELRTALGRTLPEYMVPSAFVLLEALPMTPNGKIDRKALPAPDAAAAPGHAHESPVGDLENTIAAVWSSVLRREHIGRHDNFFDLGGHSLLAATQTARLRQTLGVDLALRDLFAQPVLSDYAELVRRTAAHGQSAITAAPRGPALPLSFAQQRLWFLAQMKDTSEAYHIALRFQLDGPLDRVALKWALDRIVERHEALRTTFGRAGDEVVQVIAPAGTGFAMTELELAARPDAVALLAQLESAEAARRFDLDQGPLLRGQLIGLSPGRHVLLITMHHIVSDGWSMGIFIDELGSLYRARVAGQDNRLPPLAIQYADYAVWQRNRLQGDLLNRQSGYWRRALAGAPALLAIPTDRPRSPLRSFAGAQVPLRLEAALTQELKLLSQRHGVTLYMTVLAAWAIMLSRLSGQDDVVIGTPVANRTQPEIEGLIGFFVNTQALRVQVAGAVLDVLRHVKSQVLDAQEHQDLPFEKVVELVKPARNLSHTPVFQVMLAWQSTEDRELDLPGITVAVEEADYTVAKFDLELQLGELDGRIDGVLSYATALFERGTIERHVGYLRRVLEAMVADDTTRVDRIGLLGERERQQVLVGFNVTQADYPGNALVHQLFEAQAAHAPQAIALRQCAGALSYGELNRQANQLAHHLLELGVQPDDRVAICAHRSMEALVGVMAILKAGGAYVPLDPDHPAERLAHALADSAPKVVLLDSRANLPDALIGELAARSVPMCDLYAGTAGWAHAAEGNPRVEGQRASHLAYIIYTSGSTGAPKGVMVEHRQVVNLWAGLRAIFDGMDAPIRVAMNASLVFDASVQCWVQLLSGHEVVPVAADVRHDGAALWQFFKDQQVDAFDCTPVQLEWLLAAGLGVAPGYQPKLVMVGGEAIPPAAWHKMQAAPRTRFFNVYGPTECTVDASIAEVGGGGLLPHIGRPISNARFYLLDAQGECVPIGVTGEIHIAGDGLARGYLNRADLTAERFVADPFGAPGARMYKTGDLGRWRPDGTIEYLGRNDFQVKIRGFRIELGEIEARLAACDGVRDAVVIAREAAPGDTRLVAYLTAAPGAAPATSTLRAALASTLPGHMVPSAFVMLAALPLTSNGKVDRKALPEPDPGAAASHAYQAPAGEMENAIAAAWASVLKLARVGRDDNFFELGGHSLLVVQTVALLGARGIDTTVTELYGSPTVRLLSESLLRSGATVARQRALLVRRGTQAALFLAHDGYGDTRYCSALASQLPASLPIYGLPPAPRLDTVDAMARRLVGLMREVQPLGPYRIAGWSFGGLLAYQMARQLRASGERVEFLALIDTFLPGAAGAQDGYATPTEVLLELCAAQAGPASTSFEETFEHLRASSLMPPHFEGLSVTEVHAQCSYLQQHTHAMSRFHAEPLDVPVHLFVASAGADNERLASGPALGWQRCMPATLLHVRQVPGSHMSMMRPPHVPVLAGHLAGALGAAREQEAGS
jgi:amino acid adenylation domain-containing protein